MIDDWAAYVTHKNAALALAILWGLAACLTGLFRRRRTRGRLLWALAVLGVPALGWLTYMWGPGVGVGAFALGIVTLRWSSADHGHRAQGIPAE